MTKRNETGRALFLSIVSLVLSMSMLVGTTMAWFTDSVESGKNQILAGNLDVELEYYDGANWNKVTPETNLFEENTLWEPGHTEVVYLRVSNQGTLGLEYMLSVTVASETPGTSSIGEFLLSDYLEYGVVEEEVNYGTDREAARKAVEAASQPLNEAYSKANALYPASNMPADVADAVSAEYVTLVVYMPEDVDNRANYLTGTDAPQINLGISLIATQYPYEEDSFGKDYDYTAEPILVTNQTELSDALNAGVNDPSIVIVLANDVELSGEWTPIGNKDKGEYFTGILDGNGYTISGLSVSSGDYVALVSAAKDATIRNLTVEGAVSGDNAAGIVARVEGATLIENCVNNAAINANTKGGGIVCNVTKTNPEITVIKDCVNNGAVSGSGTAGLGGITGYVNNDAELKIVRCVNNAPVTGSASQYAGAAVGYAAGTSAGIIVDFENSGTVAGKDMTSDALRRYLESDGVILAGYCGTPANWAVSHEVAPASIESGFEAADGTDITKKISKVVFGTFADYPAIAATTPTKVEDGVSIYQVAETDGTYTVYYLSDSKISAPANSKGLFQDMSNVTEIDVSNLDMSQVENAVCMFKDCTNLVKLDTSNWDTSSMTNMQSIFYGCNKLEDLDVSNWDTSNVTNMRMVFFRCYALSNDVLKGVENWDVSNVSNFYSMFKHARGLTSLDLSKWDTSSATNMSHLFANIGGLEYLDLSSFDTSNVTDMSWMFYDASKLTTIVVGDGWTTAALDPSKPTCFYNNQALVGGQGTTWLDVCDMANPARPWESSAKIVYATVDGGTQNPGLLTHK